MEKIRSNLFFWSCILLVAGMLLIDHIRILPSISMILIVLLGVSFWIKPAVIKEKSNPIPFISLVITFLILLPSWFYSNNQHYLLEKWQIAIPYLLLPLAFIKIPALNTKQLYTIYELFFLGVLIICLIAFVNYLFHQEAINQLYLESRVMPTILTHHPTLSLMIVLAVYLAYFLFQISFCIKFPFEKYLILIGGIFLFIFLHVFSVRSGLLAMYLVIFLELTKIIFRNGHYKKGLLAATVLVIVGGITVLLSPTARNKITNTSNDINNYKNGGSANNQSLASRMVSFDNALQIAKESNYIRGCGLGDISDLNSEIFRKNNPDVSKEIIPHNQFLFYLAAIGISGMLLFIISFYFPLFYKKSYLDPILFMHLAVISVYFMVEAPIETQVGVAFSIFFYLLPLHQKFGPKQVGLS